MGKKLKEIVQSSSDLYFVKVDKPAGKERHNMSSWTFRMEDPRWTDESFKDYRFRTVHLRRDNGFFLAYKSDQSNAYFVDTKRAMFRSGITKYVNSLVDYSVKSNDISRTKNEPSFRITQGEMKHEKIDNFLDLCYAFRDYTAIGTGYTRNIRNLVVMDIDVDCSKSENMMEINNLLRLFANRNALPDFYIYNHQSNHIQLQWLIKDLMYKEISDDVIENVINELNNDPIKNKEIDFRKTDFTEISPVGVQYRKFTRGLCGIVKNKKKFGDRQYTFWKAKNPMSALIGAYDLELFMPYLNNGEIDYMSIEEMNCLFSSKDARREYMEEAPDLMEWYAKLHDLLDPIVSKITDKKVLKLNDAEDVTEIKETEKQKKKKPIDRKDFGESRNTFVFECTRYTTWEIAKKYGCRKPEDFNNFLTHQEFNSFRDEVYNTVYSKFKEKDEIYHGVWPDTSNFSPFPISEFKKTFSSAWTYAIQNINNFSYSGLNRENSKKSRGYKKDLKLIVVDGIRRKNTKITRDELLSETNKKLQKIYVKKISMGSLKRFIAESNELTDEKRNELNDLLKQRKKTLEEKRKS